MCLCAERNALLTATQIHNRARSRGAGAMPEYVVCEQDYRNGNSGYPPRAQSEVAA